MKHNFIEFYKVLATVRYMQDWEERILIKEEGREEGREEGILEKSISIASSLLDILDVETIAKKVGLEVAKVEQLKKEQEAARQTATTKSP